ncbi:MAG: CDP-diacylglycerol--serine O-phosphatidyltransferase [Pseudomonadota bacterium]|nr:CDP-diacylglycerol--serine O-phosphatidyltransferase [Pseudomonadota bacterium]
MTQLFPPFEPEKEDRPRRRPLMFSRASIPIRALVPSLFTLMALCAGLTAIRMAIEHRYDVAVAALVLAAFLDGIDGRVARLLKATTRFGAELDSLADFVNFGVAPAIVIFTWALGGLKSLGWIVVLIFAICAALRLARFNVTMIEAEDQPAWKAGYFVGIPAPAGALIVLLPLYAENLGVAEFSAHPLLVLVYTLAIAILMVSRVPTYSGKKLGQRVAREYVLPVFVLAMAFFALLVTYPDHTLTFGTLLYLAVIPLSATTYQRSQAKFEAEARASNGSSKPSSAPPHPEPPAAPHG